MMMMAIVYYLIYTIWPLLTNIRRIVVLGNRTEHYDRVVFYYMLISACACGTAGSCLYDQTKSENMMRRLNVMIVLMC